MAGYLILCSSCIYLGPLGQEGFDHHRGAPRCARVSLCSLIKEGVEKLCSLSSALLLAVPEGVSYLKKVRSITYAGLSLQRELCLWDA